MGKRGPKPSGQFSSKGATLSARIKVDTRKRLEAAAKASGLSLSQEVEARLASSLDRDQAAGWPTERALLQLVGLVIDGADEFSGQSWRQDPYTFDLMAAAIGMLLKAFRPPGDPRMPLTIDILRHSRVTPALKEEFRARLEKEMPIDALGRSIAVNVIRTMRGARGMKKEAITELAQAATYLDRLLTNPHLHLGQSTVVDESLEPVEPEKGSSE